jgi:predicted nucleotidyltransferase
MVTLDRSRAERREEILRLAEQRGAHNLRVFGSVARGEASEDIGRRSAACETS